MRIRKSLTGIVSCLLLVNSMPYMASGQVRNPNLDSPIVISIGRPNIWSLEQAHYLLARMHHRNRELEARPLNNLNPNEINANQIKLLRQILGISADYAQTKIPKPKEDSEETTNAENKASLNIALPTSAIDKLPENSFSDPKLNASTELDNYINLQYEIIARQLTLLRDEVGPGERLVFLELPHSIFTTDKKADKKLVQVWWQIEGFSRLVRAAEADCASEECRRSGGQRNEPPTRNNSDLITDAQQARSAPDRSKAVAELGTIKFELSENKKSIRTVDLIPRQSSLILNKTYDSVSGLNLFGGFSWLFGLGVKGNYQRQKEVFEQYLHQEVYASAFGKGESDFGWTFAPTPGTKRLNPGLRTVYAVAIVPKEAETISLNAKGCFFKQNLNQPYTYQATSNWNTFSEDRYCELAKNFIIPVPNGGDHQGLYVSDIRYHAQQDPGSRITVSVKGGNFSPQIGVMINGVPLRQSVGIAQPFLDKINSLDTSYQAQDGISGEVEYIDSDEIVFAFRMPKEFESTPTIHLIGPGRAVYLNKLPNVKVNGNPRGARLQDVEWMFGSNPPTDGFTIADFKVFATGTPNKFTGSLIGKGFASDAMVFINGVRVNVSAADRISDRQIGFEFVTNPGDEIIATVKNGTGGTSYTDFIAYRGLSPFILNQVTPLSYENEVMLVKIDGLGLRGLKILSLSGADANESSISHNGASQAFLRLVKPKEIVEVTLENSSGLTNRTVIVRPKKT